MHGVRRDEAKNISPEKLKEQQETIERGRKLWDRMLQLRSEKAFTYEALKVTQKLIEMNPECYTPWNYRKQILLAKLGMPSTPEPEPEPQPEPTKSEGDEVVETKVEEANKAEGESTTTEGEPKKEEQTNVEPEVEDEEAKKKRQQEEEDKKRQEEEAKEKAKKEAEEKRLLERETKITLREKKELIQTDILEITNRAIRYNAKCYHVWYHRRWIMLQMKKLGESIRAGNEGPKHSSDTLSDDVNWQYDLDLTTQFLKLDSRNFHCWGYRRFVVTESGVTDEKELEYTETKLGEGGKFFSDGGSKSAQESSFSNYSAWHLRSLLLTKKIQDIRKNSATPSDDVKQLLDTEFEFVGQIVATHNGQSPWLYHRWLISQVEPEHKLEALQREITLCEEIIKIDAELSPNDPPPKWATLTKALLLQGLKDVGETVDEKNIEALVDTLEKNDPDHSQFYSHLRQNALKI